MMYEQQQQQLHQTEQKQAVLIVDDVKEMRDYLSQLLSNLGYWSIDCVGSASQAYQQLNEREYGMVFLDIELPDADGKDMLNRLCFEYPDTKVVMCSSHNTLENVKQTWELGAKGFISKPFNENNLATIVRRIERN